MKRHFLPLLVFLFYSLSVPAQHTFSIVAVDPVTGEVGSAGATCLDVNREGVSALIISDLLPGRGAIHTQAAWRQGNQQNARSRMELGESPEMIIDWLVNNDIEGNSTVRQYGIADFDPNGDPRAFAFTGNGCQNFKGHRYGTDYSLQGNILINTRVLDSMQAYWVRSEGLPLADRLMMAMQGANRPGADSRCWDERVSSRSSFLRVARPDDTDSFYLDLHVPATPYGVEPLDSLQNLFDQWKATSSAVTLAGGESFRVFPNPTSGNLHYFFEGGTPSGNRTLSLFDLSGKKLLTQKIQSSSGTIELPPGPAGALLLLRFEDDNGYPIISQKIIRQ